MSRRNLQKLAKQTPVTGYVDYRVYLQDLYHKVKAQTAPYSYLHFAEDLGFSPTNMIRLVIARKRLLADKSAQTIVKGLDLRKEDRKYFLALVKHINARSANLRAKYFQRMLDAKQASNISDQDRNRMEYYQEWHYPVVREVLRLDRASSQAQAIADKLIPNVSQETIRAAFAVLQSVGLVTVDAATGAATLTNESPMLLPSDATAGHLSIARYHQAMLDIAKEAVTKVPASRRELNALTVALSTETFKLLRRRIREVCAEVMTLESQDQARDCVAQFNIQLFALTKPDE